MKTNQIYLYTKYLSLIGLFLASYLIYNYFFQPSFQPCHISQTINCDLVTKGVLATFLGIPVGFYGFVGYLFILIGSLRKNKNLVLAMAAFGMLFCLRMTILEIFFYNTFCPVCLTCQLDMLLIFVLGLMLFKNRRSSQPQS